MMDMGQEPIFSEFSPVLAPGGGAGGRRRPIPGLRRADGEEEGRAERHWREVGRGGGENPEDPPAPEDRERWRERRLS